MSLDISIFRKWTLQYEWEPAEEFINEVWEINITHNLISMAMSAGLYEPLWRPYMMSKDYPSTHPLTNEEASVYEDKIVIKTDDLISHVEKWLAELLANRDVHEKHAPPNWWGSYRWLVCSTKDYLKALKLYPGFYVKVSR